MSAHTPCHMIQDLLPLYLDDLVSEESAAEIEQEFRCCSISAADSSETRSSRYSGNRSWII